MRRLRHGHGYLQLCVSAVSGVREQPRRRLLQLWHRLCHMRTVVDVSIAVPSASWGESNRAFRSLLEFCRALMSDV
jgi:uncharacterized protein YjiS (DUF1127 family)